MSVETRDSQGEIIEWSLIPIPGYEKVHVGRYEFERTDFYIAILDFLAGSRSIPLANETIRIEIPEKIRGTVQFGHIEMPYEQFVGGIMWGMSNSGRYADEFQVPLTIANSVAQNCLEKKLKENLPERRESLLRIVEKFRKEHLQPGGIYGLNPRP